MENDTNTTRLSRRTYLKGTAGAVGAAGLTGHTARGAVQDEPLEVLHGWTGGDGQEAINALIEGFGERHPDMETDFRAVGSTANIQLNQLVVQRLANNDPPSSWAAWPGKHLTQFTEDGLLGDITESVWAENDMEEAYLDEAKELSKFDDSYVCVPIGSHRLNNLFYNVEVIESAGIDPESISSPGDLVDALATVEEETDAVGMAQSMTSSATILQLWAAVMLGSEGFQPYMDLIAGNGDAESVKNSLQITKQYAEYFNEDAPTTNPPGANQKIVNGEAGFLHQGNWMAGEYRANDLEYGTDWGWVPFPGTEDMYTLHFDSFVYPKDAPASDKAIEWLRYCGTVEAQVEFNKRKGSIPPRTDAPKDEFGEFLQQTMEDFKSVTHKPPTIAHGLAVSPSKLEDIKSVFTNNFMGPFNVDATAQGIMDTLG